MSRMHTYGHNCAHGPACWCRRQSFLSAAIHSSTCEYGQQNSAVLFLFLLQCSPSLRYLTQYICAFVHHACTEVVYDV